MEIIADKGYECPHDMVECLEKGVIPNVNGKNKKKEYKLETAFEEKEIDDKTRNSKKADDIKKCLRAGVIPEVYKDVISKIEITEKKILLKEDGTTESDIPEHRRSEQEMRERALEGYFVRDLERNIVYCPGGFTLRPTGFMNNGQVEYTNRIACRDCSVKNRCNKTKRLFMGVKFTKDTIEKPCRSFIEISKPANGSKTKRKYIKKTIVKIVFKPDYKKNKSEEESFRTSFRNNKKGVEWELFPVKE